MIYKKFNNIYIFSQTKRKSYIMYVFFLYMVYILKYRVKKIFLYDRWQKYLQNVINDYIETFQVMENGTIKANNECFERIYLNYFTIEIFRVRCVMTLFYYRIRCRTRRI